jgi:hypothetical protein
VRADAAVTSGVLKSAQAASRVAELLICCATSVAKPERTARLHAIVDRGVDWKLVVHLAQRQAVMPLVYNYLTAVLGDALPPAAASDLRRAYFGNAVRNLSLARELVRVTTLLERGGVEPLALKGPALALAAYGAIALRQFTDLDLLVRASEVERTVEILLKDGYAPRAGFSAADLRRRGAFEIAMVNPETPTEIDLHWRLVPPYFPLAPEGDGLWQRTVRIEVDGTAVRTLAPADHLLYLCAHGAKHGWEALGGICDLAELMRHSAINWNDLCAQADHIGAHRVLALGLILANELLDAPVPESLLQAALREPQVMRAAQCFIAYVRNPSGNGPGPYQRWSIPLRVITKPGARMRYVAARALLPSADDREFLRLPEALDPLYYLIRPLRVALKEGPSALRRWVRLDP